MEYVVTFVCIIMQFQNVSCCSYIYDMIFIKHFNSVLSLFSMYVKLFDIYKGGSKSFWNSVISR
jgi:hypothetical protein